MPNSLQVISELLFCIALTLLTSVVYEEYDNKKKKKKKTRSMLLQTSINTSI